jgi:Condensation domain
MTRAQQEIRLASALRRDRGRGYLIAQHCEITGPLDHDSFTRAVTGTVATTDAIRVNAVRGRPWQTVRPVRDVLSVADVSGAPDPVAAARALIDADLARPVDLTSDPLFIFRLVRLGPETHWWQQTYHHFAVDVFGMHVVERRVANAYGEPRASPYSAEPQRSSALRDALAADEAYATGPRRADDRAYWVERIAGWRDATAVPAEALAAGPVRHADQVAPALAAALTDAAKATGAKKSDVLLAACALYLRTAAGWGDDVVIGAPVLARKAVGPDTCPVTTANLLPLRVRVPGHGSARDLVHAAAEAAAQLRDHARYRGEDLTRDLDGAVAITDATRFVVNHMPFTGAPFRFGAAAAATRNVTLGYTRDLALSVHGDLGRPGVPFDLDGNSALHTPTALAATATELTRWLTAFPRFLDDYHQLRDLRPGRP